MNVRCSYCRHAMNLSREYMVQAVTESAGKGQKYHAVECSNCRKLIKVPLSQLRRYVPSAKTPADEEAS